MRPYDELTSRDAVDEAIAEFDHVGRHTFLERYGLGEAREYFLVEEDRHYDSKAIFAAAYEKQHGVPPSEFTGGKQGAAARLTELGYAITGISSNEVKAPTGSSWVSRAAPPRADLRQQRQPAACTPCGMLVPATGVCDNC
ncbi:hypothetical protein [Agrococcus baldri]|uniref:hypothetical protein n=1 Tax=Agrococcus baldri TaxID=153730 RepID=UPI0011604DCF|nr:hypothetical protein [Agrococcus baldri]